MQPHPIPTVAPHVRIFIGAGMSFEIPRDAYDEALRQATQLRKVMYVGLMPNGTTKISANRDYLFQQGCDAIAWLTPMNGAL